MIITGLDLSLTRTGVATIDTASGEATVQTITSKPAGDTLRGRTLRLRTLARKVVDACCDADLVVIEQPAFSRTTGHHHDRSGLWWLVVDFLGGEPIAEVPPTTLKRYATGKGNAGKDEALAAVIRRFPAVNVTCNDEADALILAAMGADHLGCPIADLPQANRAALDAVRWPKPEGDPS